MEEIELALSTVTTDWVEMTTTYFNSSQSDIVSTTMGMTTIVTPVVYCGKGWADFWAFLVPFNLPARAVVCLVGIVTNILNILVFTRKSMRNPTNTILTALSIADLLCLLRLSEYETVKYVKPGSGTFGDPGWSQTQFMAIHTLISDILVNVRTKTQK